MKVKLWNLSKNCFQKDLLLEFVLEIFYKMMLKLFLTIILKTLLILNQLKTLINFLNINGKFPN